MEIGRIENATRILGRTQGYYGLPIRDELIHCTVNGQDTPVMVSAWYPTQEELSRLNTGAPIYVRIIGTRHPPINMEVGEGIK
jgi:hypothetical protein